MPRALLLLALLPVTACQGVAPATLAAAPPEVYWVEYYEISER